MRYHGTANQRRSTYSALAAMAFAVPAILPLTAHAQAVAGVPTRDELKGITQPAPEARPELKISGGIERSPCALADPRFATITVTINSVDFHGLKEVSAEELAPAWQPFAGKPQPVSVICEIRDAAATILREKGYLAAVEVPTQRIENGYVRLEVLYARVTAIRARGETRGAEAKLEDYLGRLTQDEVFNRYRAERYLLLARDLPGYNVQLTLKPAGTGPGDLVGEVTVLRRPYVLDFTVQNLAAEATGRWGGQLRAQVFGLTGMGDVTSLSYYATSDFREQHIVQASHEFRPGSEGLAIGGQFTYAWTRPDIGATGGAALDARTLFASLYARYPVRRSQGENLWVAGGFDLANQDVGFIGPLTRDKLRVLWAKLDFDAIDLRHRAPRWRVSGTVELRQGLDALGATRTCVGLGCPVGAIPTSRFDGSPGASVIQAEGDLEVSPGAGIAFALQPRAQYAFKPLLSFEEFAAGNYTLGRGYDPGTLTGDSGLGAAFEVRGPRFDLRKGSDAMVQPYAFFDAAWVWNKGTSGAQRLTSAGAGLRSAWSDRFRLDANIAVPLEATGLQTRRPPVRFLVSLTTRLLPWGIN
ncbi:MAG: ShlB/FhaC/HecB family hemolysin secretion/activation protein [Sphingomonadales bacterium]|nr:ShlB/FhaC/HecB family hemolysin secretion/activation protein [Sphingomonadales bacterium]MDE2568079.1 ShlB/FhaC/HecB family hemolysin secretion/activation protein [Sphingomonadales bacterium]